MVEKRHLTSLGCPSSADSRLLARNLSAGPPLTRLRMIPRERPAYRDRRVVGLHFLKRYLRAVYRALKKLVQPDLIPSSWLRAR